ncbi:hypothetical protein CF326_g8995, partial [Tilletia indica]
SERRDQGPSPTGTACGWRSKAQGDDVGTERRTVTGQGARKAKIQGVKMEGKAREIIAMISRRVKARARQRQDGQRPIEGRDRRQATGDSERGFGAKTRHLRNDLGARDTGSGMARLVVEGQRRR